MKKTDIAAVILIVSISLLVAYFLMGFIFDSISKDKASIQIVAPIGDSIVSPNPRIFNKEALNPTVPVVIGGEQN